MCTRYDITGYLTSGTGHRRFPLNRSLNGIVKKVRDDHPNKEALKEAGIEFKDVEVTDAQKAELKALTGKTSVPQVFVKGQFIGGCNDGGLGGTVPLLKSGKLQEMLK